VKERGKKKTDGIGVRITPELKLRLEAVAKRDDRSVASVVEILIKKHLPAWEKSLGITPPHDEV